MRFAALSFRLLLVVFIAALGLAIYEWVRGHPQDVPWTPLSLSDRTGRFTNLKISRLRGDSRSCRRLLEEAGARYVPLPPVGAQGDACGYDDGLINDPSPGLSYAPRADTSCSVALGLFLWERQVLQPAAERHFGQVVRRVDTYGSYACRPVRGGREGRWSEHARANAIDVAGFRLVDGRRITVAGSWTGKGPEAAFLHEVRDGACKMFGTVLSPDYNALHRDHLHLDRAARGGWGFCR